MEAKEFKVGQLWRRRDGQVARIMEVRTVADGLEDCGTVTTADGATYALSGAYWFHGDHPLDLIDFVADEFGHPPGVTAGVAVPAALGAWAPAIPDTEIARIIAQFINDKRISLDAAQANRVRIERELNDIVAHGVALAYEIEQAEKALAALK